MDVCEFEEGKQALVGQELRIEGHYFRGKEGSMIFDQRCKAYLPLKYDTAHADDKDFRDFDIAWKGGGGNDRMPSKVRFSGRVAERQSTLSTAKSTYIVLVADAVEIVNPPLNQTK